MGKERILVVDDENSMCEFLSILLNKDGYKVVTTTDPNNALKLVNEKQFQLAIIDVKMPHLSGIELLKQVKDKNPELIVIMVTAYASVETALQAMKNGAYDYITKPFKLDEIRLVTKKALEHKYLREENRELRAQLNGNCTGGQLVGNSLKMREVKERITKLAQSNSTVLIRGESGTGKELAARAIHLESTRADKPFVAVDCSALPEQLLESELFGHVKGAFTGAVENKMGLFKVADGGTLFLDEVGETSLSIQVKLLRVLQERVVRPVGGTDSIAVDVRIIAATNKDLEMAVRKGEFRGDLYYRINVVAIDLPPLRERKEDVPVLVSNFLRKYDAEQELRSGKSGHLRKVTPEAIELLMSYDWPGNVRELENVIEGTVTLSQSDMITPVELRDRLTVGGWDLGITPQSFHQDVSLKRVLEGIEKDLIQKTLQNSGGNQSKAARKLRLSRQNLQYKIKKYRLNVI